MDAIPELNLPGLSPTAAKGFASARFASDGGLIPRGTPREIYMYHARDFQDEYHARGKRCISFLWDFIALHSWTPTPYNWTKPINPTIIKLSKQKASTIANTNTNTNTKATLPGKKLAKLWCKVQVRQLVRRLDTFYGPHPPTITRRNGPSVPPPYEYYDAPLHPVPPHDKRPGFRTEREVMQIIKDMREAAKKISAKEFVQSDVQVLLKKTDLGSLVERYLYMLDKGEFKFLEKVRVQGNSFGFV
ncbi:hypothetical protein HOY82DRAFT_651496 [Tuber indicum]|nr:hypothetical protein HOY82DRAFT_651496 [Tuber indicum]